MTSEHCPTEGPENHAVRSGALEPRGAGGSDRLDDDTQEPALMDTETTEHMASEMATVARALFGLLRPHRIGEPVAVRPSEAGHAPAVEQPTIATPAPAAAGYSSPATVTHGQPPSPLTGPASVPLPQPDETSPSAEERPRVLPPTLTSVPLPATVPVVPSPGSQPVAATLRTSIPEAIPVPGIALPETARPTGPEAGVEAGTEAGAEAGSDEQAGHERRQPNNERRSMALLHEIAALDE